MMVTTSREEHQRVSFTSTRDAREREEDSQAPPDLEPVQVEAGVAEMGQYGDEGYEPSADELIDVLKNLENLAAANPGLYRAIVEQIKGTSTVSEENVMSEQQYQQEMDYQQQMQYQQEQQEQIFQQQLEQQQMEFELQQQQQQQQEVMMYE